MKKYIYVVVGGMLLFQLSDALKLSQYHDFQEKKKEEFGRGFDESTDLVRGLVVLQNDALKGHRHYGNAEFDPYSMKSAEVCSYNDKSSDAMTQLLILTFPSAGASGFSAYGEGSIGDIFTDTDQLMQLIAGMFKIANEVREYARTGNDKKRIEEIMNDEAILLHFGGIEKILTKGELIGILSESFQGDRTETFSRKGAQAKQVLGEALTLVKSVRKEDFKCFIEVAKMVVSLSRKCQSDRDRLLDLLKESKSQFQSTALNIVGATKNQAELENLIKRYNTVIPVYSQKNSKRTQDDLVSQMESKLSKIEENTKRRIDNDKKYVQKYIQDLNSKERNELEEVANKQEGSKNTCIKLLKKKKDKLIELGKAIADAVLLERVDGTELFPNKEKLKKYPYYIGYANNIICAYACSVINTNVEENLTKLAGHLSANRKVQQTYESELTEKMKEYYDKYPSYIPFDAGSTPITNGSGVSYKSHRFADCVETTMRQLFAVLFCSKKGKNGEWTEDLHFETSRIPGEGKLHDFFQKHSHVDEVANGGNTTIRTAWAGVCSGHQEHNIEYAAKRRECELEPEWRNMIRLFCLLMSGYDAAKDTEQCNDDVRNRKQEAAELIRNINNNKFDLTDEQSVINALNTLLGVRGDVQFEVINPKLSINNRGKMVGEITICPKTYTDGTKEIKSDNNKVCFCVSNSGGHASVKKIEKVEDPLTKVGEQKNDKVGLNYIGNLYSGRPYMIESRFPALKYYLESRMLDNDLPDIANIMRHNLSGQYNQGIYRLFLATRGNFPGSLDAFFKNANNDIELKPGYLALGKVFFDYSQDDPRNFSYYWRNISKFIDLDECVDQSTRDRLYAKWSQISTIDDLKGLDCFLAEHTSIDATILENLVNVKDWKMEAEDWVTICRIFNRVNFTDDKQYSSLKSVLAGLQDAAKNFLSSHDYRRSFVLTKDFTGKEEILKIVLPFCSIDDPNIVNNVKDWIAEKEKQEEIDEKLIIPVVGYLSNDSFEKFLMSVINQKKDYFERSLRHIVIICRKNNEERGKKASNLILSKFPKGKIISESLAGVIAGQVDDIPALMKKVDLKDRRTLRTVFTQLGKEEREDRFISELVKIQDPRDLIESILALVGAKVKNLGHRLSSAFIKNKKNIPLSVAEYIVAIGTSNYDWLTAVEELYDSVDNVSALLSSSSRESLADHVGKAYVKKKRPISMPVAKVLIKAGASGGSWLKEVKDLFDLRNISEILEISEYNKERIADSIGKMYVDEKKPISLSVAKVLIKAGAFGNDWLSTVKELYESDDNVAEIFDVSGDNSETRNKNNRIFFHRNGESVADKIGQMYIKEKKSISMRLAKILVSVGAFGDDWLSTVKELYDSEGNVDELLSVSYRGNRSELANEIGNMYMGKERPISIQLAKILLASKASGAGWLDNVVGLYDSTDNVAVILNAVRGDKVKKENSNSEFLFMHRTSELADKMGRAYIKKKKPISLQLAKLLIEFGACGRGWLDSVTELYDSDDNIFAFLDSFRNNQKRDSNTIAYSDTSDDIEFVDDDIIAPSYARDDIGDLSFSDTEDNSASVNDDAAGAFSKYGYNMPKVADTIGQTYAMKKGNISMQLADTLIEAGALKNEPYDRDQSPEEENYVQRNRRIFMPERSLSVVPAKASDFMDSWLFTVNELYSSDDNAIAILNKLVNNKRTISDALGMSYAKRKVPVSMRLAKAIIKAGGEGDYWIHTVDEVYNSIDNVVELINASEYHRSSVVSSICQAYAKRKVPISLQLAKTLIKFGSYEYGWIHTVDEIYDSIDNVVELIKESGSNHSLIANAIGKAYVKRNMPISIQLAKVLIESEAFMYDWLSNVENLFEPGNVDALLKVAGGDRDLIARKIAGLKNRV